MSIIPDDKLFSHSARVSNKVVVITGAANGIGKEAALQFARHGAKVVVADLDLASGQKVVSEIKSLGGQSIAVKCDVTVWEDLVAMFGLSMSTYGCVDIVIPNAGISEHGSFTTVDFQGGQPVKPSLRTLEVNLLAVLNTVHLAQHYLQVRKKDGDLKAIILIGSMASWAAIERGSMYSASKHAILGTMRSLHPTLQSLGIRIAVIHPWFADTGIIPIPVKLLLAGIPLTPVSRIGGAIFYAATDPSPATDGCAWLLPDDGPVFLVPKEEFKLGVYGMIDARVNALQKGVKGLIYYSRIFRDIWRVVGTPLLILFLGLAGASLARRNW